MHQQLWGYKVEDKLYVGVREQRSLNTTALCHRLVTQYRSLALGGLSLYRKYRTSDSMKQIRATVRVSDCISDSLRLICLWHGWSATQALTDVCNL
jgi:hypothetical protein